MQLHEIPNSLQIAHNSIGELRAEVNRLETRVNLLNFGLLMMGLAVLLHLRGQS